MRVSWAIWEPVDRIDDGPRVQHRAVIFHTNGGKVPIDGDLFNWWSHGSPPGVGVHFQITTHGRCFQYLDTDRMTGHAWAANSWTVAVETQDDGDPSSPWTQAQLDTIDRLLRELQIPARLLDETPSDGIGWHEAYPSWNRSNHDCPGTVREAQIVGVVRRLKGEDDLTPEQAKQLADLHDAATSGDAIGERAWAHGRRAFILVNVVKTDPKTGKPFTYPKPAEANALGGWMEAAHEFGLEP